MRSNKTLLTTLLSMGLLASAGATQAAGWCESGKPVKFAGLNWESGMLLTDVMQIVLEKGYDCKTDSLPGNSITMENALSSNDIQVFAEEWVGRSEVWNKAEKAGKVVGVGAPVVGAIEGWYVPRYVIEGDAKRKLEPKAPDLKAIADLGKYATVFKDQEEPAKGRFYNCPAGWTCELDNSEMLKSYGLESTYTNFRPGTGSGAGCGGAVELQAWRADPVLLLVANPADGPGRPGQARRKTRRGQERDHQGRPVQDLPRASPGTGGRAGEGQPANRPAQPEPRAHGQRADRVTKTGENLPQGTS
jgi:glycine betaine/proline transport system substrate-binding protein